MSKKFDIKRILNDMQNRKLTGAERYSRRVAVAITAGGVRRGFLKGLKVSQGCAA
jgi:hypothetical protein